MLAMRKDIFKMEEKNLKIIDYNLKGQGIAKKKDNIYFIENALKDEIVDIAIIKQEQNIIQGKIINILEKSSERTEPLCPHYQKCGGCNIMHFSDLEQDKFKKEIIANLIKKHEIKYNSENITYFDNPNKLAYRNKITFTFGIKNNKMILGFNQPKSHDVVEINNCYLIDQELNDIKDLIYENIKKINDSVYNKKTKKGNLQKLTIRKTQNNELMVILNVNTNQADKYTKIYKNILQDKRGKNIKSFIINKKDNSQIIIGQEFIQDKINNIKYNIRTKDFFQVNNAQTVNIYENIKKLINPKHKNILDAYCGIGSIGTYIQKDLINVFGIEIINTAIKSVKENALLNNKHSLKYYQGDISKIIQDIYKTKEQFDTVIIDPPRKGIPNNFLNILNEYLPKEIIYLSCNPQTLMKNLKKLENKYQITHVSVYDMFSQTNHIETLVKLEKK